MLPTLVCLLAAAVVFVLVSRRLGFGSILGYLVAGAVIGPSGLRLVRDVHQISEISELGVLMLLFLIGLELRIQRLWLMRKTVFGLGGAQVAVAGGALTMLSHFAGIPWPGSAVIGFGLALSSTAIVLPMLADRDLISSGAGRDSFAVLLFQDMASIPMIALVPLLAARTPTAPGQPPWLAILGAAGALAAIVFGGRYLIRPLFRVIGGMRTTEVFTATALFVVAAAAMLAEVAGLPMSLGAFAAGVVLSESAYRHELQADIEPFEGLLLGFFFISVGMAANVGLALAEPVTIVVGVIGLLALKVAVGFGLEKLRGAPTPLAARFALSLPQGSEFAFVLFGAAVAAGALAKPDADRAMLVVAMSMFASPILFSLSERFLIPRLCAVAARPFDTADDVRPAPVVICGFGRVGQIVGRVLAMRQIRFNALDPDSDNVDTVRRFGYRAYFGDPTRIDLLRAVGVGEARLLVVALPDVEQNLKVVETARRHFPDLQIYARARNRRHYHLLVELGAETIVRETFFSSLKLSELVLGGLGVPPEEAKKSVQKFREHDEQALVDQHGFHDDEKKMIQSSADAAAELQRLFETDLNR